MEEETALTTLQQLRHEIQKQCPVLPDYKIIELCNDYGINYEIPDVNTYRLISILASAEIKLIELQKEKQ